ncbi:hypothetical protein ARD30_16380 [Bosea thiooxidans]|uniref:Acyl carrier protein n=1 Tax=Bosea thiooxidans TaxID=53254 RepID=A0A0Q3I516_9HYPH|nr:hypothetical protein [Bosea thiooxidans]KQK30023.1 hypothetical protein ARD30_16380 [Bosea thiooxidans]
MSEISIDEARLVARLLEIIAAEGLVKPELLEPDAVIEEIGLSHDDLTLIGNAIEREFSCDLVADEDMQTCNVIRELVALFVRRVRAARPDAQQATP